MRLLLIGLTSAVVMSLLYFTDANRKKGFPEEPYLNAVATPKIFSIPPESINSSAPLQTRLLMAPVAPSLTPALRADFAINQRSLTSPIKPGGEASLEIETLPETSCALKVILPSGVVSKSSGLKDTLITDNNGVIRWKWRVGSNTSEGLAILKIACSHEELASTLTLQMVISK